MLQVGPLVGAAPDVQKNFPLEKLHPSEVPAPAGVKGVRRPADADHGIPKDPNAASKKLAQDLFGPMDDL